MATEYTPHRRRVSISIPKAERRTKSSFMKECDINNILKGYQKTGALTHMNNHQPEYGFATGLDFKESLLIVDQAKEMFADLPSSLRKKFDYNPAKYLDFVSDESNAKEMAELGLLTDEAAIALLEPSPASEPTEDLTPTPDSE